MRLIARICLSTDQDAPTYIRVQTVDRCMCLKASIVGMRSMVVSYVSVRYDNMKVTLDYLLWIGVLQCRFPLTR